MQLDWLSAQDFRQASGHSSYPHKSPPASGHSNCPRPQGAGQRYTHKIPQQLDDTPEILSRHSRNPPQVPYPPRILPALQPKPGLTLVIRTRFPKQFPLPWLSAQGPSSNWTLGVRVTRTGFASQLGAPIIRTSVSRPQDTPDETRKS